MRSGCLVVLGMLLAVGTLRAAPPKQKEDLSLKEKASYSIGMNLGRNLKAGALDIDVEMLGKGVRDALSGGEPLLTESETEEVMAAFEKQVRSQQAARAKTLGASNQKQGQTFLAQNKNKQGVKTTKSGLQYKVIKTGKGPVPTKSDTVKTHYRGTLIDGKEFDSSYRRNQPAVFPVMGVIKGWTEALQLMPVGSKWQLFVPASLAYGERGAGADIGPSATLIFEVELLDIVKPEGLRGSTPEEPGEPEEPAEQ